MVLGATDPEVLGLMSETVTHGDPTYAGPLTNVALQLPVYHIFEPEVKDQIPTDVYARSIGKLEILHDVEATVAAMRRARAGDA